MDNQKIGNRIKYARELRNLTLSDIAEEIGVAKSTIQRYENGLINKPKLPVLQAIANSLKVNPSWLTGLDVPMESNEHFENETYQEMDYDSFIHNYLGYESPNTVDNYVDLKLKSEPNHIYRVTVKEYNDFYEFTKERIDREFAYLLEKAEKINLSQENIIKSQKQVSEHLLLNAAHERTDIDVTNEMKKHDDDIMMNDEFWK